MSIQNLVSQESLSNLSGLLESQQQIQHEFQAGLINSLYIKKESTTALHYNSIGHDIGNFRVQIIERVVPNTPEMLLEREHFWIQRLQTKLPHGLNTLD